MASASTQQLHTSPDSRPYYCHQCHHEWNKLATALFQCPQCNDGFIEEVTDDFRPRRSNRPLPESRDFPMNFISILNEFSLLTDEIHERGRARPRSSNRAAAPVLRPPRGGASTSGAFRQPRAGVSVVFGQSAEGEEANDNENNDIRIRFGLNRGGRGGFFTFPIDDVMTTLFAAAVHQGPVMTDNQLQEIPKATITTEDVEGQSQCAICFEDYKVDEEDVRKLPCTHLFHEKCIFPWLKSNATCPVCRARMPNATDNESDSEIEDVVIGELSRIMDYRGHQQPQTRENRNGESSRANNNNNNNANSRPGRISTGRPPRIASSNAPTTRSSAVQTRASHRERPSSALVDYVRLLQQEQPNPNLPSRPSAVQTRASDRERVFATYERNLLQLQPNPNLPSRPMRRTRVIQGPNSNNASEARNLRREPVSSRIPVPTASSSNASDRNLRLNQGRERVLDAYSERLRRLRPADRISPLNPPRPRQSGRLFAPEELEGFFRPSTSGITTRTRARTQALDILSSSSSSSSSSMISISSDENIEEEPPRRRRRIRSPRDSD